MDFSKVGQRIREQRQKSAITIEVLAEKTNLSILHMGHIERGARNPSIESLVKIANTLCVSVDYLLFGDTDNTGIERHEFNSLIRKCSRKQMELVNGFIRLLLKQDEGDS